MHLTEDPLDLAALLEETATDAAGALVAFGGTVRMENEGRPVNGINYTTYAPLAAKTLAEIEQECLQKFEILACRIAHRTGALKPGELSVLVVVRAAHRPAAFDAARHAIDALKQRVAIWKEEQYIDGAVRYLEGKPLTERSA